MKSKLLAIVIFLLMPYQVFAYEPESGHSPISAMAVDMYNGCYGEQSAYNNDRMKDRVVSGSKAMDLGLKLPAGDSVRNADAFSVLLRPFNWHFYSIERAAYSKSGWVNFSFTNLWNMLYTGMMTNYTKYNRALFIGGLLHFFEDLTVPGHVVPVYHGPTAVVAYGPITFPSFVNYMIDYSRENLFSIKDHVDEFPVDSSRLLGDMKSDAGLCDRVTASNGTAMMYLRDDTYYKTLKLLNTEIPNCPNVKWADFYSNPVNNDYFGKYNIKNGNPLFGDPGVLTSRANNAACNFLPGDVRYKDFAHSLHKHAVETDMKALAWGQTKLDGLFW